MTVMQLEIPDHVSRSLGTTLEGAVRELRMAAAVKLYELGRMSSGRAAELAGVPRVEFLQCLGRYEVSPLELIADELGQDVANA